VWKSFPVTGSVMMYHVVAFCEWVIEMDNGKNQSCGKFI
jgi:hypothetical protein